MRSKIATAAALIAALTPLPSNAGPIEAPPVIAATVPLDTFVAPHVAPVPAPPPVRLPRELDEPVPYLFQCEITRWTGDPANATTTVERVEGELGDDPVHFEADSYLIDDGTGKRGGGYDCTLKVGDGPENPDSYLERTPLLVAATLSYGSHGHTIWKPVERGVLGVAGARMGRWKLQRGHSMTMSWAGSISQSDTNAIEHAADCEGVTIRRGFSLADDGWCEHENPLPRSKPAPDSEDKDLHDGLPSEVPAVLPALVDAPAAGALPSLPPVIPSDAVLPPVRLVDELIDARPKPQAFGHAAVDAASESGWSRRGDLNS